MGDTRLAVILQQLGMSAVCDLTVQRRICSTMHIRHNAKESSTELGWPSVDMEACQSCHLKGAKQCGIKFFEGQLTCDQAAICHGQPPASPQPQVKVSHQSLVSQTSGPPTQVLGGEMLPLLLHTPAGLALAQMTPADQKQSSCRLNKHSSHQVDHGV